MTEKKKIRLYLAGRGITTNEAFKWEMIEESVDRGELFKLIAIPESTASSNITSSSTTGLKEEGFSKRYNKSKEKEATPTVREKKIENFSEIENIYDKGFIGNLKEVFFPPKLN